MPGGNTSGKRAGFATPTATFTPTFFAALLRSCSRVRGSSGYGTRYPAGLLGAPPTAATEGSRGAERCPMLCRVSD